MKLEGYGGDLNTSVKVSRNFLERADPALRT